MTPDLPLELSIDTLLPLPYTCFAARWTTEDTLTAIWGACAVGFRPDQYIQDAFIFQNDTKSFVVTVSLPESGDSLADASEIIYRIINRTTGATVIEKSLGAATISVSDATHFRFTLDNSETAITPTHYKHECRITANGEPTTILTGRFTVVDTIIGDA